MKRLLIALAAAVPIAFSALAAAQAPAPAGPPPLDPAWKVPEVIAFIGVKPGDKVADVVAGRLTASLAKAVGPTGKVYAVETAEIAKTHGEGMKNLQMVSAAYPNVIVSADPVATPLPHGLDAVFIRQNYHDLYDKFMGPADVPAFNRNVYAALKPGGVYVILDHVANASMDFTTQTEKVHRIDPARVKADVEAAGFKLVAESDILKNPADDHTKMVFAADVRGHTDQFLFKFRKPK